MVLPGDFSTSLEMTGKCDLHNLMTLTGTGVYVPCSQENSLLSFFDNRHSQQICRCKFTADSGSIKRSDKIKMCAVCLTESV